MTAAMLFLLWRGFAQSFLGYPGLLFQSGFGDVYLIALFGLPGLALYQWGKPNARP